MNATKVTRADEVPQSLQRAAKVAIVCGASVAINCDRDSLLVTFKDSDQYYFDPEHITLHCLEMLGAARTLGLVFCGHNPNDAVSPWKWGRVPLVIRTVFSNIDVRVQIGASKWFTVEHRDTAVALRQSLVNAFCAYYDEAIAPYPAA